eukprot:289790-Chlamydomonas_euryale.AAC.1
MPRICGLLIHRTGLHTLHCAAHTAPPFAHHTAPAPERRATLPFARCTRKARHTALCTVH